MARVLELINGVPRMRDETGGAITIYDESITIVASSPGANELVGPIVTGTPVTLPSSKTYDSNELEVYINGQRIEDVFDYNLVGSPPRTQVSFTFDLEIGDIIRFRIDRSA